MPDRSKSSSEVNWAAKEKFTNLLKSVQDSQLEASLSLRNNRASYYAPGEKFHYKSASMDH